MLDAHFVSISIKFLSINPSTEKVIKINYFPKSKLLVMSSKVRFY